MYESRLRIFSDIQDLGKFFPQGTVINNFWEMCSSIKRVLEKKKKKQHKENRSRITEKWVKFPGGWSVENPSKHFASDMEDFRG